MPTLCSMVNETGNRNRILEMCKFRIWIRLGITSTIILHRFSSNFACGSEMWSLCRLLFVRETGSSLRILEVCGFQFWQFSGCGDRIFQQISMNENRNSNQMLEMCKFRIRFRLVHCLTITSVTRYGFRQILHADQKCDRSTSGVSETMKRK